MRVLTDVADAREPKLAHRKYWRRPHARRASPPTLRIARARARTRGHTRGRLFEALEAHRPQRPCRRSQAQGRQRTPKHLAARRCLRGGAKSRHRLPRVGPELRTESAPASTPRGVGPQIDRLNGSHSDPPNGPGIDPPDPGRIDLAQRATRRPERCPKRRPKRRRIRGGCSTSSWQATPLDPLLGLRPNAGRALIKYRAEPGAASAPSKARIPNPACFDRSWAGSNNFGLGLTDARQAPTQVGPGSAGFELGADLSWTGFAQIWGPASTKCCLRRPNLTGKHHNYPQTSTPCETHEHAQQLQKPCSCRTRRVSR